MIVSVVKDTGGLGAVLPVHEALRKQGVDSRLIANGVSRDVLCARKIPFTEASSVEEVLEQFGVPEVLVTSMCTGGGVGRDLIPLLAGRCPTVVVQDQWGVLKEWADLRYCPDHVVVNDSVGTELVHEVWSHIDPSHIHELGFAALDVLAHFGRVGARRRVRERFGIASDLPVLAFFGQFAPTGLAAEELVRAMQMLRVRECVLLVGLHPRFDQGEPHLAEEGKRIREAFVTFPGRVVYLPITPTERIATEDVIAASDVVLTMYSTGLTYAAALQVPGIAILYPNSPMQERLQEERAGTFTHLPLGELGCVAVAQNLELLTLYLRDALSGALAPSLRHAQETNLRTDGTVADRIATHIASLKP